MCDVSAHGYHRFVTGCLFLVYTGVVGRGRVVVTVVVGVVVERVVVVGVVVVDGVVTVVVGKVQLMPVETH